MDGSQYSGSRRPGGLDSLPVGPDTPPMEAKLAETLPVGPGWQFEPKWDGFRCLAFRAGAQTDLRAKSGKPLARYFPDMVEALAALGPDRFVLDGELVIARERRLSFEDLQLRLHPAASRVAKLAAASPAILILFDMLVTEEGRSLLEAPLPERRAALERFYAVLGHPRALRLSPFTRDRKQAVRWLAHASGTLDGVIAKPLAAPYLPGERAMIKVKRQRTADCVVGGFRYAQGSDQVGSLLLGLYDKQGKLHHVGFTSTITEVERPVLTRRLKTLIAPPGFTGDAPGGPSRWSTERTGEWQPLKPDLVVEVRFDQVTGGRFRHGTRLLRWRPDKAPRQCSCEQIAPAKPPKLLGEILD